MIPKVSVIVPVYNTEKYLKRCLDSIINQTLRDIEVIIIDDGSTDLSGEICDDYAQKDSRLNVIHQTNRGLGLTRNVGLVLAKGEYVGFVDSDDFISKDMYEKLYNQAIDNNADVSYCLCKRFTNDLGIDNFNEKNSTTKIWADKEEIRKYMLDRIGLPPSCKEDSFYGASVWLGIFSNNLLRNINAKFESERNWISEDTLFNIDVIPWCRKIVHNDEKLYYYRVNFESLTMIYNEDRFKKNIELYHEMKRRLNNFYSDEEMFDSMSRYLLTFTRIALIQEIRFLKNNGIKYVKNRINDICNNKDLESVLANYQYYKMPIKYSVLNLLIKNKRVNLIIILIMVKMKLMR